ncbi:MAG TPA: methyltransferase domain-containing protein [Flavobacteriaceae bacterium]|nr:methyltransferase domain-containing protein [Flavobacteriaceae bacterium]HPF12448.1 methyltransferase domain-containing protein [Flavobacteriaceae bacterium]HQU66206.1 methyltransferase domain-containing protein [Flavobacteriaceae bacterium]
MILLNLGCGSTYHKDWKNIDFISNSEYVQRHNLLKGIPLEENSVDILYHSHVLEHFSKEDGKKFIQECYRVLKRDGIIRIAVPDFEKIAREYIKNLESAETGDLSGIANYEWITLELFDQMVRNKSGGLISSYLSSSFLPNEEYIFKRWGSEAKMLRGALLEKENLKIDPAIEKKSKNESGIWKDIRKRIKKQILKIVGNPMKKYNPEDEDALQIGRFRRSGEIHQWMYDKYSLKKLLSEVGFSKIALKDGLNSEISNWEKYNLDSIDGKVRKPDSLFMEAKKA